MHIASDIPELSHMPASLDVTLANVKKIIRQAWKRHFGDGCPICGSRMHFEIKFRSNPRYATIDHILARALGGTNSLDNLTVVCMECNNNKSKDEFQLSHLDNG